jgi:hypothetical protein
VLLQGGVGTARVSPRWVRSMTDHPSARNLPTAANCPHARLVHAGTADSLSEEEFDAKIDELFEYVRSNARDLSTETSVSGPPAGEGVSNRSTVPVAGRRHQADAGAVGNCAAQP